MDPDLGNFIMFDLQVLLCCPPGPPSFEESTLFIMSRYEFGFVTTQFFMNYYTNWYGQTVGMIEQVGRYVLNAGQNECFY